MRKRTLRTEGTRPATYAFKIESAKLSYGIGLTAPDADGMTSYTENLHIEVQTTIERPANRRGERMMGRIRGTRDLQDLLATDQRTELVGVGAVFKEQGVEQWFLQTPQDTLAAIYQAITSGAFQYVEITVLPPMQGARVAIAFDLNVDLATLRPPVMDVPSGGAAH